MTDVTVRRRPVGKVFCFTTSGGAGGVLDIDMMVHGYSVVFLSYACDHLAKFPFLTTRYDMSHGVESGKGFFDRQMMAQRG